MMSSFFQSAAKAIRESGGRVTSQRRAVIEVLDKADDSLDAETIHQRATEYDANINLATVYRILHTFEEARLVRQRYISKDHDRKVYDVVRGKPIYHFTCRVCGKTVPFETPVVDQLKQQLAVQGLQVDSACMCVSGICDDCKDKTCQENDNAPHGGHTSRADTHHHV